MTTPTISDWARYYESWDAAYSAASDVIDAQHVAFTENTSDAWHAYDRAGERATWCMCLAEMGSRPMRGHEPPLGAEVEIEDEIAPGQGVVRSGRVLGLPVQGHALVLVEDREMHWCHPGDWHPRGYAAGEVAS